MADSSQAEACWKRLVWGKDNTVASSTYSLMEFSQSMVQVRMVDFPLNKIKSFSRSANV